jgi:CMP-N-acetylneuraminic acid synthetase
VVSVKKNENPIQMAWKNVNGYLQSVMPEEYNKSTMKQDHYDTFFYNDAIIFDTVQSFMDRTRNLYGHNPVPYLMPWERSIAIDYEFQLKIAQCLGEKNG